VDVPKAPFFVHLFLTSGLLVSGFSFSGDSGLAEPALITNAFATTSDVMTLWFLLMAIRLGMISSGMSSA
jgi:hypothetical protein